MSGNYLREALEAREFVFTAELVLGRDHEATEAERFIRDAAAGGPVRVVSVTDLAGGHPALPPEGVVEQVARAGLTPIAHVTGKDGNRSFLEARLHSLARAGVQNILALTGDAQRPGFAGTGKPVHDLDSVLILRLVEALRGGLEHQVGARTARTTPFDFFPGAVVNPYKVREPDLMMQLYKLELKIAAGARFVVTQLGFDLRKLNELRQYMVREGLGHIPVLANVYVPTARMARMARSGELAGCVVTDDFVRRLESEARPARLERAALMVAAARELGFAGAHIGGYGLKHRDVLAIVERAAAIGSAWRGRMDELTFAWPGGFYLLPAGADGLSDAAAEYQLSSSAPHPTLAQRFARSVHRRLVDERSRPARFLASRLSAATRDGADGDWRRGLWPRLLGPSTAFRELALGCDSCGDCIQDHLEYAGCSMRRCYKELRNGPCGGSRPDGSCEARPTPCLWNLVYEAARAAGDDPRRYARVLVPPRDWTLDRTNALANRLAGLDNLSRRAVLPAPTRSSAPAGLWSAPAGDAVGGVPGSSASASAEG